MSAEEQSLILIFFNYYFSLANCHTMPSTPHKEPYRKMSFHASLERGLGKGGGFSAVIVVPGFA